MDSLLEPKAVLDDYFSGKRASLPIYRFCFRGRLSYQMWSAVTIPFGGAILFEAFSLLDLRIERVGAASGHQILVIFPAIEFSDDGQLTAIGGGLDRKNPLDWKESSNGSSVLILAAFLFHGTGPFRELSVFSIHWLSLSISSIVSPHFSSFISTITFFQLLYY